MDVEKTNVKYQPKRGKHITGLPLSGKKIMADMLEDTEADLTYSITLRNASPISVRHLEVEYHFYNLTRSIKAGQNTAPEITDITSIEQLDLDAKKSTVLTKTIPQVSMLWQVSHTQIYDDQGNNVTPPSIGMPGNGVSHFGVSTDLIGWRVEVRYNGAVITHVDEPFDLKDKLDQLNQEIAQKAPKAPDPETIGISSTVAHPSGASNAPVVTTPAGSGAPRAAYPANAISFTVSSNNLDYYDVFYTITIRNSSKLPASGLEVEYHFYYLHRKSTGNVVLPPELEDISAVQPVDITPQKPTTITTKSISTKGSRDLLAGLNTETELLGWHVEVRDHGRVISEASEPSYLQDRLDQLDAEKAKNTPTSVVPPVATGTSGPILPKGSIGLAVQKTDEISEFKTADFLLATLSFDPSGETSSGGKRDTKFANEIYTISIKNNSRIPAQNLTVEYHFYNLTTKLLRNVASPDEITDISLTKRLDLAPGKTASVVASIPQDIIAWNSEYKPSYYAQHNLSPRGPVKILASSITTNLLGWKIEVRDNGLVIAKTSYPYDLQDKLGQSR